jgi:diguanylate cyclase (GGDEF)-like protein
MMPEMDGKEVLEKLREGVATRNIPVMVLTALGAMDDKIELLDRGAVDFLTKPADPRELIARIRGVARIADRDRPRSRPSQVEGRGEFMSRLAEEVARSSRSAAPLSILVLARADREGSPVPDTDERVARASAILRSKLRLADCLFHLGGNEFGIILPDTSIATGFLVAERCREALDLDDPSQGGRASVGVAEFSQGHGAEELIEKARIALAHARESGGGRSWRADDLRRRSLNTLALSEDLTDREWDVLRHLAYKRTEVEIAKRLGIQTGTVRSHKARIRRKLQVAPSVRLTEFARNNLQDILVTSNPSPDMEGEGSD